MRSRLAALPPALRAAALYALAVAGARGLGFVLLPVSTATLTPAEFARLDLLLSFGEIGGLLLGAGLVDTLYRFAAAEGRRGAARVVGLGVALGAAGLLATLALAPFGAALPLPAPRAEVLLLGAAVALDVALGVPLAWLRVEGRAGAYAASVLLRAVLHTALAALLLVAGWGVAGVLAAAAAAALVAAIALLLPRAGAGEIAISPEGWGRLLAYGVPLTAGGLASFALGTADRWFLAPAVPAQALAQYALAAKLAMAAAFLTQPFELWWYPQRLSLLGRPDGAARTARMVGLGGALVLLAGGAAAVAGPALIAWATPPAYHPAAAFVPWLALALALQSLGSLVNVGCYAGRTGSAPLAVNGAAALLAVALYALLIPAFGVAGAVAATIAAQAARLVLFHAASARVAPIRYPLLRLAAMALPVALAAAAPQALGTGLAGLASAGLALLAAIALALWLGLLPRPRVALRVGVPVHA